MITLQKRERGRPRKGDDDVWEATHTRPRPNTAYRDHFCLRGSFMFQTSQKGSSSARKSVTTLR